MKVLMIEPLGDGGITHYTFNLLSALSKMGLSVVLFTAASYEFIERRHDYKIYPLMFRLARTLIRRFPILDSETTFPSLMRRLVKVAEYPVNVVEAVLLSRKEKADVAHLQSINVLDFLMVVLFRLTGLRVVVTIHNVVPMHNRIRFYHRAILGAMYRLCNQLIIHTNAGKEEVIRLYHARPDRISVIPHGNYNFFLPEVILTPEEAKKEIGLSPQDRTILFFGAIRPNKGLDHALCALARVREKMANVKLLIVGEVCGGYAKYEQIIQNESLRGFVYEHLGYVPTDKVAVFLFASDIVVLPYDEVTQSGVLYLAYAFSKPVIASSLDGFRESIDDGKNGYLVTTGDHEALAEKMLSLLCDDARRREMGSHSRFLSEERYSWESIARQTNAVYGH